jgi:hypothetical protein
MKGVAGGSIVEKETAKAEERLWQRFSAERSRVRCS